MFKYNKKTELQKLSAGTFQKKVNKGSHMEVKLIFMKTWKIHLDIRTVNYSLSSTIPENCLQNKIIRNICTNRNTN